MAHLTDSFTFEGPLSPRVQQAIGAAFEQGWADPKKLSQASHRALDLRSSAIEEFAGILGSSPASVEILGEPHLIHHLAIQGFLQSQTHLRISSVDVGKIRAVARAHTGQVSTMAVAPFGEIELPKSVDEMDLISLQVENGETGIRQNIDSWRNLSSRIVLDATRTTPQKAMVDGFASATFDSQSWSGPAGLGFLVINDSDNYRYPFAHIAPIRTPGSYSLPLLVGAVVALNEYLQVEDSLVALRKKLANLLGAIDGITLVGDESVRSRFISFLVSDFSGEEVLRALLQAGSTLDAGSACSPEDLTPSHVIAAMGLPTTGHLRATVHAGMTTESIENLATTIKSVLQNLRR